MVLSDRIGIGDDVIGQGHHRLRVAGAERPCPRDGLDQRGIGAGGAHRPVDQQRLIGPRRGDRLGQFAFEIGAEFRQRAVLDGDARRHGMAAALEQQALGHRAAHGLAEIDAEDGTARAGADAAGLERDGKGRAVEALLETRREQTDHARMPVRRGRHHHRALFLDAERGAGLGLRLLQHRHLHRAPLAVEAVELGGDASGLDRIVGAKQQRAEIGAADAAAGVDARPEQEAQVKRLGRPRQPRHVHQRGEADVVAAAQRQKSLGDEGAVEALERHHIGDGAERDNVEPAEQVGLRPRFGPEAAGAQHAVDRDHGDEHHADGGEMAQPRKIVEPVGIDHDRIRQPFVGLVMIDDDDVETKPPRLGQRLDAGGAAIDGDEQFRPAFRERADRLDVGAVAFEDPVGDMHDRLAAAEAQEARQQGRGGRAIDIVVAEDRDLLAAHHGVGEAQRRLLHRGDGVRIGHQPPHRRIEEGLDLVDLDAAAGENARQQLRHIVPLRDGERPRRRALVEPVPPGPAADRTLDAEKQARGNLWRQRQGGRHEFSHRFETVRRLYSAAVQRTPSGRSVATIHRGERIKVK